MQMRFIGGVLVALLALACRAEAARWIVLMEPPAASKRVDFGTLRKHLEAQTAALQGRFKKAPFKLQHQLWIASALAVEASSDEIRQLAADPAVRGIEADGLQRLPRTPAVPATAATTTTTPGWNLDAIGARRVWSELGTDGTGVTVGIIDSGIEESHPALTGRISAWRDFTTTASPTPTDVGGHGTHVAGIICGKDTGVAPGVKLVVARVFGPDGAFNSSFLAAMQWMLDPDGDPATDDAPRVVSNSWGNSTTDTRTFWDAVTVWRQAGILPSFSIGNYGPRPGTAGTPGAYPHAFATGACGPDGSINRGSSRGPAVWNEVEVVKPDIAAPGLVIRSTWIGGGYRDVTGTSMACPHVSATAALMRALDRTLTVDETERILRATAHDLGPPGADSDSGAGCLDAFAACRAVLSR